MAGLLLAEGNDAMDRKRVLWPKLREYFIRVSSCRSKNEFMHAACVEIQRIIPFDETAGIFDNSTSMNLEGTGKSVDCTLAYTPITGKSFRSVLLASPIGGTTMGWNSRLITCYRTTCTRPSPTSFLGI